MYHCLMIDDHWCHWHQECFTIFNLMITIYGSILILARLNSSLHGPTPSEDRIGNVEHSHRVKAKDYRWRIMREMHCCENQFEPKGQRKNQDDYKEERPHWPLHFSRERRIELCKFIYSLNQICATNQISKIRNEFLKNMLFLAYELISVSYNYEKYCVLTSWFITRF